MKGKMQRTTNEMWHVRKLICVPRAQCVGDRRERVKGKRAKS